MPAETDAATAPASALVDTLADRAHAPLRKRAADGAAMPLSRATSRAEAACRLYPGKLPHPADGKNYTAHELAALGAGVAEWLAVPLARQDRTLAVFGAGSDRDAQLLCNLLRGHLAATGETVRVVDGTKGALCETGESETELRSLIYGGGFDQSARRWLADEIDAEIVIAVSAPVRGICEILQELQRTTPGLAGKMPYVVAIDD